MKSKRFGQWWRWVTPAALMLSASAVLAQATIPTTTTLISDTNPVIVGEAVLLTATVTGTAPTGTVTFKSGTTNLGTRTLSGSGDTKTVTFLATFTTTGAKSLTAVYAGNATNIGSTSPVVNQTVNKAASSTVLTSSPNPASPEVGVTFTATVSGYIPAGTVTFKRGTTNLGTASLSGTGNTRTATFTSNPLSLGAHTITAVYAGDSRNITSTSAAVTQMVRPASTTTVLADINPSVAGQVVTLTATVEGSSPSGSVTFTANGVSLGSSPLSGGIAILSTSAMGAGYPTIVAEYSGDSSNAVSYGYHYQQVDQSSPVTTVAVSPASVLPSQTFTLSAQVTGHLPTGSVAFLMDGSVLGSVDLIGSGGPISTATLVIDPQVYGQLPLGMHTISAAYGGDVNNSPSNSSDATLGIKLATTTALTVAPNPSTSGESITLTATIAEPATGTVPAGSVTFFDGLTALGIGSVNAGVATFTTAGLGIGSHSLSARYDGDAIRHLSTSANVGHTVGARTGMTWQYGYDAMGRINTMVDPNGNATYIYYDSLGRPIQTQQPPNEGTSSPTVIDYAYNLADGLTQVTDPRSLATTYTPNGLGNVTSQSSPDTGATQYNYDAKGNVLTSTDSRGKTTTYVYDNLGKV